MGPRVAAAFILIGIFETFSPWINVIPQLMDLTTVNRKPDHHSCPPSHQAYTRHHLLGLSDVQRYSMAIHWIGAGANLITGSDLTHLDELGRKLLYDEEVMGVADFTRWVIPELLALAC